jgi:uncharacterized protein (DUF1499 family)
MRTAALCFSLVLLASLPLASMADASAASPGQTDQDSPLPACPESPNCELTARSFPVAPDSLFRTAQDAVADMGPVKLEVSPENNRMHAVFRVALIFKDDVDVAVTPADDDPNAAVVHIRSASRVGYSDLGVNARRVDRFFRTLTDLLEEAQT